MKCINHAQDAEVRVGEVTVVGGGSAADYGPIIAILSELVKVLRDSAEKPPYELRVPLPEFHNAINVPTPRIDFHAPPVENRITVNPTPVEVVVETPAVDNHVVINPTVDLRALVVALYVLTGVIGASALGVITSLLLR